MSARRTSDSSKQYWVWRQEDGVKFVNSLLRVCKQQFAPICACSCIGVFQNNYIVVPQRTIGCLPIFFTLQLFGGYSIWSFWRWTQCFTPLGCPNHVRPERSRLELVQGVPRSLNPHPTIKRVSMWCYTKLCGYKQRSRRGWNHTTYIFKLSTRVNFTDSISTQEEHHWINFHSLKQTTVKHKSWNSFCSGISKLFFLEKAWT